jgi:GR25 family glycosyltransferase involved in LPS biosynthesis
MRIEEHFMRIEEYFTKIFCIHLNRRTDRGEHARSQFELLGIPSWKVDWFSAYDCKEYVGTQPVELCTLSHQAILHMAGHYRWERVLLMEDDFEIRSKESGCQNPLKEPPQILFDRIIREVPQDWELLYLGAQYESEPKGRVSEHVVIPNRVLCTSSYAVTWQMARKVAPYFHCGAPDTILSNMVEKGQFKAYVFQPRLFRQWNNFSDLEGKVTQGGAMDDVRHERMC